MSIFNPIANIGDVIRGSLLADTPDQIPHLLKSVTDRITALGGKFYIKNFWNDPKPLSLGYVGVHIKIRLPLPSNEHAQPGLNNKTIKYILMELQLHIKEIMDGSNECAKEIAHRIYKAPREAEEKISQEVISGSQLVYLTAMTRLLASKEDLARVDELLQTIQTMTKADKKMRLIIATALLLHNINLAGVWNEHLQVVVPKDKDAVAMAWMSTAKKINELLNLPVVDKDEKEVWTNTASTIDELYADAALIAPFFKDICRLSAYSLDKCSVNFGPADAHMIKEKPSLEEKIKTDFEENLRNLPATLQSLNLSHDHLMITDQLAHLCLWRLTELQELDLSNCDQLTDNGLVGLGNLTKLRSLNLSGCTMLTNRGIANLTYLTELRNLDLSNCTNLTDYGLKGLASLNSLETLSLANCSELTNNVLACLKNPTGMLHLNLEWCFKITDEGLNSLSAFTALQTLLLDHCKISVKGLASLRGLNALQHLTFYSSKITDNDLINAGLERFINLLKYPNPFYPIRAVGPQTPSDNSPSVSIHLSENSPERHGLEEGKRPPAEILIPPVAFTHEQEVAFREVTEIMTRLNKHSQIIGLKSLAELKHLNLSKTALADNDLIRLVTLLGGTLQRLDLTYCTNLTDTGLACFGQLTQLESLNLFGCDKITDGSLFALASLTQLRSLFLNNCTKLTDRGVASLQNLTGLQDLSLRGCSLITDQSLANLSCLRGLQSLNLYECSKITDVGIGLLKNFAALAKLKLGGRLSDAGIASLEQVPSLNSIDLRDCHYITFDIRERLRSRFEVLV